MAYQSNLLNSSLASASTQSATVTSATETNNDINYGISLMMVDEDTEPIIEIDADLRKISIPNELKNIAVAGDHLSEEIFFRCPRYFDGNDLSEHDCIIRFINAGNEYGEDDVLDMTVGAETLQFGWLLNNYATRYSGTLAFTVQFETEDNGIKYQWQTTPATLNILAGLKIEKTITNKDDVLFRTITNQIQELQNIVNSMQVDIDSISEMKLQITNLQERIKYLEDNVVYAISE